jgi:hypothetical protein
VVAAVNAGSNQREGGDIVDEPQAVVDRLEARDLMVRAFGVIALLVVAFIAVAAI